MNATIATDWPYRSYPGRLPEPGAFPFPKPKSNAAKQAAKLHAAWAKQHAAVSAVESDLREAQETARAAEEALERAFGDLSADPARTVELTVALEDAKARATEPWTARYQGAIRAATAASGAYATFVDEHLGVLLAELEGDAAEGRSAIVEAARPAPWSRRRDRGRTCGAGPRP
jgi:hypothetical protein